MDYTVGSLADLISDQNTPNKPKVSKIAIKTKKIKTEDSVITENGLQKEKLNNGKSKKRKAVNVPVKKAKKLKTEKETSNTLADSDDEESVNEPTVLPTEENTSRRKRVKKEKKVQDPEEMARTIFVGNVPLKTEKKKIKRFFKKHGVIECLRFRGIPVANPKMPKKVAAIKKEFHPDRDSVNCYIRFVNKEDAQKALQEDGALFEEHHLRVQTCDVTEKPDESKAIFIGNLIFKAKEDDLWKLFEPCGPISHVRIIRDTYTGMGKGFAYVNFKESDSVQLALEMENVKLGNRELRISLSSVSSAKKNKKNNPQTHSKQRWRNKLKNGNKNESNTNENRPKWKTNDNFQKKGFQGSTNENEPKWKTNNNFQKKGFQGSTNENQPKWKTNDNFQKKGFQGSTFNLKKKNKVNKGLLNKKLNVKKIAPISD